jgi:predicted nucleic acid-binding protein
LPPVYVDAAQYIALVVERDRLHESALRLADELSDVATVTSDPVLVEVLAYLSGRTHTRLQGIKLVELLRADPRVTIVRQTPELFDAGFDLYKSRPDKGYSLTDCMSMIICRQLDITDVATHDRHFAQAGFRTLL